MKTKILLTLMAVVAVCMVALAVLVLFGGDNFAIFLDAIK